MKTYNYFLNSIARNAKQICIAMASLLLMLQTATVTAQPGTPAFFDNFALATVGNAFPLNSTTNRVQWIFAPGVFASGGTGVGTPAFNGLITKVYIKFTTVNPAASYSNFTISLAQNVGTLTSWTNTTWQTGLTQCFFQASGFQFTGALANSWYGITLQTPFLYDPAQSLVMEIKVSAGTGNTVAQQTITGVNSRMWGTFSAPTATSFGTGKVALGFDLISATPCAGTPDPGNTIASVNPVCPSTLFTLSPQNVSSLGSGNTFLWESSPDGSTWSPAPGANTNLSYSTSQTVNTYYRVNVTCTNSSQTGTSTPVLVTTNSITNCYCSSNATSTADEEILNVTVGSLNNSSICGALAPGAGSMPFQYSNYRGFVPAPSLAIGGSIPFSIQRGTCGGNFTNRVAIFIDFNGNGLFTDAGENPFISVAAVGPGISSGLFTVPLTATAGTVGMRIVQVETSGAIAPCGTYTWGETEDYLVNLVAPVPCSGTPTAGTVSASATSVCGGTNINLSLSGSTVATGISYQWKKDTGSGFVNFGTNSTVQSDIASVTTTYRVEVTCANSSQTSVSNDVTVNVVPCIFLNAANNGSSTITCASNVFDSGGPDNLPCASSTAAGSYQNNENYTYTFNPPPGNAIKIVFNSFCTETSWDRIYIYDGPTTSSPLFNSGNAGGSGACNTVAGGWWGTVIPGGAAGFTSTDGPLTLRFCTDASVTYPGFSATVSCVPLPDCAGTPVAGTVSGPATTCASTNFTLTLAGTSSGVGGITRQWQKDTGSGFVNFGGGLSSQTDAITVATTYRVAVTCTPSGLTSFSNEFTVTPVTCIFMNALNNGSSTITCAAQVFDSGGPDNLPCASSTAAGSYQNNENYTYTFNPPPGNAIKIVFNSFCTETSWDRLYIYDGPDVNSPLINSGNAGGSGACNTVAGGWWGTVIPGGAAGFTSTSGAITLRFCTDASVTYPGFSATVSCVPCPTVPTVGIVSLSSIAGCGPTANTTVSVDNFTGNLRWEFEQPFGANNWVTIPGATISPMPLVANIPAGSGTVTFGLRVRSVACGLTAVSNSVQYTQDDPAPIPATAGAERCGPGNVTVSATVSPGQNIEWWDAASGGNLLSTDNPYSFSATANVTVYAANRNPVTGCLSSQRTPTNVVVHPLPVTVASNNGPLCAAAGESATAAAVLNATGAGSAVPGSLLTTLTGVNGQNGNMFDITALNAMTITSIDQRLNTGFSHSVNIYYKVGSFVGFTNTPGAWILAGTANGVTSLGSTVATPIPIALNISVAANQTIAFYVTCTNNPGSATVAYSDGTAQGSIFIADANLQIRQGIGKQWDPGFLGANFGVAPASRIWNGRINYTVGSATSFTWTPALSCSNADCSEGTVNLLGSETPYLYTVMITDAFGCTSTATTEVTINKAPAIVTLQSPTLNGGVATLIPSPPQFLEIPVNTTTTTCDQVVNYDLGIVGFPAPSLTYTFTGATANSGSGTGSGSTFGRAIPSGKTTITVSASNVCNSQSKSFRVAVTDNVPAVITPLEVPPTGTNGGECNSVVQVTQPDLTNGGLFDNCPNASLNWVSRSDGRGQFDPYTVGTTTVTWIATDASLNTSTATQDVVVNNFKPVVTSFTASPGNVIFVGQTATFTVNFTDEDGGGTHTIKFYRDKNDASPASIKTIPYAPCVNCNGNMNYVMSSDPILYSTSEVAEPKVEVFDGCNQAADQVPGTTTIMYLAVAVAGQQFTTAGGHFVVPAGATAPGNFEGYSVNIGNVCKKATTGNSFKGQLEMNIHVPNAADWRVHTDNGTNTDITWDYLTIGGCSLATFKGACRVNGATGYKVLVQQSDKDRNPATSNFIRVKVTTNSGVVVFDTQPGLTEALTSGNGGAAAIIVQMDGGSIKVQPSNTQNQSCTARMEGSLNEDLLQNIPNPFTGQTEIRFNVPQDGKYTLKVYNYLGQEVATLFNAEAVMGSTYSVVFDGSNYENGIYTYTLTGVNVSETRRMNLLR